MKKNDKKKKLVSTDVYFSACVRGGKVVGTYIGGLFGALMFRRSNECMCDSIDEFVITSKTYE